MANETTIETPVTRPAPAVVETRFVNAERLSARHWFAVALFVTLVLLGMPWLWKKV